MKTYGSKRSLFILIGLLILQLILIVLLPYRWLIGILLVLSDIVVFWHRWREQRQLHLTNREMIEKATAVAENSLKYVSQDMPVGIISWDELNKISWMNPYMNHYLHDRSLAEQQRFVQQLLNKKERKQNTYELDSTMFRFFLDENKKVAYFVDISDQMNLALKETLQLPVVGIISIDNYDDAIDKRNEREISYVNSFVTTMLSDWMERYGVFYKRVNAERYFFFARNEDLEQMKERRFDLLDKLRQEAEEQNIPITLSMGISYGDEDLAEIGNVAQNNLDIALARGGDQVVLKDVDESAKAVYYGGNSTSAGKRTRVRSRAMSTAIRNIFKGVGDIYIMGHRYPDMDVLGAAYGVACLAKFQNKTPYIIIDEKEIVPDITRCLEEIHKTPELESYVITPNEALAQIRPEDLLVMVDYNRPSLSISEDVYNQFDKRIIIDHHRRGEEFPKETLLTYIESSASSSAELVAELIQFESNGTNRLEKQTATLLLAGITVDTKNFAVRTTARTFDIASYVKSCGADTSLVQYLLSSDIASYLEISRLVGESQYVAEDIVIAAGDEETTYNSVLTAKTADTLLSMVGINASFVITKREDGLIGVSARSKGTVNVQLMMEALGGGGHFTNAAAQVKESSIAEVKIRLISIIHETIDHTEEKE